MTYPRSQNPLTSQMTACQGVYFTKGDMSMTIEIALLISGVSLAFGIYQGVCNLKRNNRCDDKNDATQLTTVIVKLENIGNDVSEIKSDMRNIKEDMKDINVRLVKMEQQVKVLNKTVFNNSATNE